MYAILKPQCDGDVDGCARCKLSTFNVKSCLVKINGEMCLQYKNILNEDR